MITSQVFLSGLFVVSVLTSLATEAIKKVMSEHGKNYYSNTIAGVIAVILSIAIGVGYVLINSISFTTQVIICLIALAFTSWLCAMIGYDKVRQAIAQFKLNGKDE